LRNAAGSHRLLVESLECALNLPSEFPPELGRDLDQRFRSDLILQMFQFPHVLGRYQAGARAQELARLDEGYRDASAPACRSTR